MKIYYKFFVNPLFIIKKLQRDNFSKYAEFFKGYILDIGCGTKPFNPYINCSKYIGMDELQDVKPDICAKSGSIPFKADCFDGVICTELLEHLKDPESSLLEIKRVLKSGGYAYFSVPQSWGLHYEPQDYWRFTKYGIEYLLKKFNFEILEIKRIGGIFSLVGQELVDVYWTKLVKSLSFLKLKWAERIASFLCFLISLTFYVLGQIADKIDYRYCLGWAVLATKRR